MGNIISTDAKLFEKLQPHLDRVCGWLSSAGINQAVLYGGALRDTEHGVPFRDFDVAVPAVEDCRGMADRIAVHARFASVKASLPGHDQFLIQGCQGNITLDVSFKRAGVTPEAMANNADVGLSGIAADLFSRRVVRSPAYMMDCATHTLSLRGGWDDAWGYIYATKIQTKYPDRPVIDDVTRRIMIPPLRTSVCLR